MNIFAIPERKLLEFLERRRVRRSFEKFLSPEVLNRIEKESGQPKPPRSVHLQFIFVSVDETNIDEISPTVARVMETLYRYHATVWSRGATLLIGCLGGMFPETDSVDGRRAALADLITENGNRIRIVHGQSNGFVGVFGTRHRSTFDIFIPGFSDILKKLLDTPFGVVSEIV
jgi:hypothetical protein